MEYKPSFDIDSLIDDLAHQLFDRATQESVSDGFELARQELSRMLAQDRIAQDMAKNMATAEHAEPRIQGLGEGTPSESEGTDDDQDGDYQDQESETEGAEEEHRENVDLDKLDACEDESEAADTEHGRGRLIQEDQVGSRGELEQIEDDHEYGVLDNEDSDSDSSSSDSGSDWAPKKNKAIAARKSRKRSHEVLETAEEKDNRWRNHKRRKLAIAEVKEAAYEKTLRRIQKDKEANSSYHPFGACDGLYIGMPPRDLESDSENDLAWNYSETLDHGERESRPPAAQKSRKRSFVEEDGHPSQPAKKVRKTKNGNAGKARQSASRPLSAAQKWFLEQAKIEPPAVKVKTRRPGAKGRTPYMKTRNDWGTPKRSVTKREFDAIRKHGKYLTSLFNTTNVAILPMTYREALHLESLSEPGGWRYELERGDVSEEDPIIDGRMIKFELMQFQRTRRGKQARRERLARGENQDTESDLSDDDSQYGDDKATCGWDLEERMEYYLAKNAARDAGLEGGYDAADEEDVEDAPRAKNKGKGKIVARANDEDYEEEDSPRPLRKNKGKGRALAGANGETDYEEENTKSRRKSKGKGRNVVQDVQELDTVHDHHYADYEVVGAIPSAAGSTQAIQDDAQSESSMQSEEE